MNNLCTKILVLFLALYSYTIYADINPDPYGCIIDPEFADSPLLYAPLSIWSESGSNAVIDSIFIINCTDIPSYITYEESDSLQYPVPNSVPNDDTDDYFAFSKLILWMRDNKSSTGIHAQIFIPAGVYNFSDQLVMHSNISLKGAGSDVTELRFLIKADSIMTQADCRKDAMLVSGEGPLPHQIISGVGIEDLKIIRERGDDLSRNKVYEYVGGYSDGY